jgi:hypothetical protein
MDKASGFRHEKNGLGARLAAPHGHTEKVEQFQWYLPILNGFSGSAESAPWLSKDRS